MQHFYEIERSYRTPLCLVSGEYPLWADRFQLPHKDGCGYFPKGVVFTAINPSKNLFRLPEKFWAKEKTLSGVYSALCLVVLELYGENHGVSRVLLDFFVYGVYNSCIMKSSELIKQVTALGWVLNRSNGSHHIFTHPEIGGHLCIPHPRKDLGVGLVEKILKQARGKQ